MYRHKSCRQTLFLSDTYWSQLCWGSQLPAPRLWAGQSGCHLPPCAGRMPSSRHAVGRHFCRQEGGEDVFVVFHRVPGKWWVHVENTEVCNDLHGWILMTDLHVTWCVYWSVRPTIVRLGIQRQNKHVRSIYHDHTYLLHWFLLLLVSLLPFRMLSLLQLLLMIATMISPPSSSPLHASCFLDHLNILKPCGLPPLSWIILQYHGSLLVLVWWFLGGFSFVEVKCLQDLATLRCKQHRQADAAELLEELAQIAPPHPAAWDDTWMVGSHDDIGPYTHVYPVDP